MPRPDRRYSQPRTPSIVAAATYCLEPSTSQLQGEGRRRARRRPSAWRARRQPSRCLLGEGDHRQLQLALGGGSGPWPWCVAPGPVPPRGRRRRALWRAPRPSSADRPSPAPGSPFAARPRVRSAASFARQPRAGRSPRTRTLERATAQFRPSTSRAMARPFQSSARGSPTPDSAVLGRDHPRPTSSSSRSTLPRAASLAVRDRVRWGADAARLDGGQQRLRCRGSRRPAERTARRSSPKKTASRPSPTSTSTAVNRPSGDPSRSRRRNPAALVVTYPRAATRRSHDLRRTSAASPAGRVRCGQRIGASRSPHAGSHRRQTSAQTRQWLGEPRGVHTPRRTNDTRRSRSKLMGRGCRAMTSLTVTSPSVPTWLSACGPRSSRRVGEPGLSTQGH
jgi:hypothetical protein